MAFPDYPFDKQGDPSFIGHEEVLEYLVKYAEMSKVLPHIKFNAKVTSISRTSNGKWKVKTNKNDSSLFGFIIVANGHYSVPYTPEQFKQNSFQGEIIHSHYYRRPEDFTGKHVTVIGNGQSGTDISVDLINHAKSITLIGKNEVPALPENILEVTNWFKSIVSDGLILENENLVKSDVFILCTGYTYDYTFAQVSYRWSFGLNSAWGSTEATIIGKTRRT